MSKNAGKWILIILLILCVGLGLCCVLVKNNNKRINATSNSNKLKELPKPEVTGGQRGELGIDKNINESNIDEYLGREDSVYRDMRMLEDPAKYEAIGGDRFLSGYIKGFEVTPLPYIIPVEGLPSEVGKTYSGNTLFSLVDGKYVANYEESMSIIEKIFPKDKVIFLMCGGGGYAGMTKNFLVQLGWDETKIYNIGGYWYYEGKNKVEVKKNGGKYDFSDVPYNEINFDKLTKSKQVNNNVAVTEIKINTSKQTIKEGQSYQLSAIVLPNEASNKNVKWTSSNEKVAVVDSNGLVNAKSVGTVKIIATTEDGNKTAECEITVTKKETTNTKVELSSEMYNSKYLKESRITLFYSIDTRDGTWLGHEECNDSNQTNCFSNRSDEEYANDLKTSISMKGSIINEYINAKKSFVVIVNAGDTCINYATEADSFDRYASEYLNEKKIFSFNIGLSPLKETQLYKTVKYNPAVIIVKEGKIYKYVDSNMNEFKTLGKSKTDTVNWLNENIVIK